MTLLTAKQALILASLLCSFTSWLAGDDSAPATSSHPEYTASAHLKLPTRYREWVYLTTGFDMSYQAGSTPSHHMFDNVFVNPEAYAAFMKTGTWPDGTYFVVEVRGAQAKGSINQRGNFQNTDVMGLEVHLKDASHGGWSFYSFNDNNTHAERHPSTDDCYTCHSAHGAVDTTFTQFYPTLLPVARSKHTLTRPGELAAIN
jgi:hypothetical protein